jgi:hypothetical protein
MTGFSEGSVLKQSWRGDLDEGLRDNQRVILTGGA